MNPIIYFPKPQLVELLKRWNQPAIAPDAGQVMIVSHPPLDGLYCDRAEVSRSERSDEGGVLYKVEYFGALETQVAA